MIYFSDASSCVLWVYQIHVALSVLLCAVCSSSAIHFDSYVVNGDAHDDGMPVVYGSVVMLLLFLLHGFLRDRSDSLQVMKVRTLKIIMLVIECMCIVTLWVFMVLCLLSLHRGLPDQLYACILVFAILAGVQGVIFTALVIGLLYYRVLFLVPPRPIHSGGDPVSRVYARHAAQLSYVPLLNQTYRPIAAGQAFDEAPVRTPAKNIVCHTADTVQKSNDTEHPLFPLCAVLREKFAEVQGMRVTRGSVPVYLLRKPGAYYTMIYSHGNAVDLGMVLKANKLLAMSQWLNVNICAYDYPGYGLSLGGGAEGSGAGTVGPSPSGCVLALISVYMHLITKEDIKPERILFYGRSLGTYPTMFVAALLNAFRGRDLCELLRIRQVAGSLHTCNRIMEAKHYMTDPLPDVTGALSSLQDESAVTEASVSSARRSRRRRRSQMSHGDSPDSNSVAPSPARDSDAKSSADDPSTVSPMRRAGAPVSSLASLSAAYRRAAEEHATTSPQSTAENDPLREILFAPSDARRAWALKLAMRRASEKLTPRHGRYMFAGVVLECPLVSALRTVPCLFRCSVDRSRRPLTRMSTMSLQYEKGGEGSLADSLQEINERAGGLDKPSTSGSAPQSDGCCSCCCGAVRGCVSSLIDWLDTVSSRKILPLLRNVPLCLVHGTDDKVVPITHSQMIHSVVARDAVRRAPTFSMFSPPAQRSVAHTQSHQDSKTSPDAGYDSDELLPLGSLGTRAVILGRIVDEGTPERDQHTDLPSPHANADQEDSLRQRDIEIDLEPDGYTSTATEHVLNVEQDVRSLKTEFSAVGTDSEASDSGGSVATPAVPADPKDSGAVEMDVFSGDKARGGSPGDMKLTVSVVPDVLSSPESASGSAAQVGPQASAPPRHNSGVSTLSTDDDSPMRSNTLPALNPAVVESEAKHAVESAVPLRSPVRTMWVSGVGHNNMPEVWTTQRLTEDVKDRNSRLRRMLKNFMEERFLADYAH